MSLLDYNNLVHNAAQLSTLFKGGHNSEIGVADLLNKIYESFILQEKQNILSEDTNVIAKQDYKINNDSNYSTVNNGNHLENKWHITDSNDLQRSSHHFIFNKRLHDHPFVGFSDVRFRRLSSIALLPKHKNVYRSLFKQPDPTIARGHKYIVEENNKNRAIIVEKKVNKRKNKKKYCKLQLNDFGKKRSLNFDLHPLMEEFLIRTMDKLSKFLPKRTKKSKVKKKEKINKSNKIKELNEEEVLEKLNIMQTISDQIEGENIDSLLKSNKTNQKMTSTKKKIVIGQATQTLNESDRGVNTERQLISSNEKIQISTDKSTNVSQVSYHKQLSDNETNCKHKMESSLPIKIIGEKTNEVSETVLENSNDPSQSIKECVKKIDDGTKPFVESDMKNMFLEDNETFINVQVSESVKHWKTESNESKTNNQAKKTNQKVKPDLKIRHNKLEPHHEVYYCYNKSSEATLICRNSSNNIELKSSSGQPKVMNTLPYRNRNNLYDNRKRTTLLSRSMSKNMSFKNKRAKDVKIFNDSIKNKAIRCDEDLKATKNNSCNANIKKSQMIRDLASTCVYPLIEPVCFYSEKIKHERCTNKTSMKMYNNKNELFFNKIKFPKRYQGSTASWKGKDIPSKCIFKHSNVTEEDDNCRSENISLCKDDKYNELYNLDNCDVKGMSRSWKATSLCKSVELENFLNSGSLTEGTVAFSKNNIDREVSGSIYFEGSNNSQISPPNLAFNEREKYRQNYHNKCEFQENSILSETIGNSIDIKTNKQNAFQSNSKCEQKSTFMNQFSNYKCSNVQLDNFLRQNEQEDNINARLNDKNVETTSCCSSGFNFINKDTPLKCRSSSSQQHKSGENLKQNVSTTFVIFASNNTNNTDVLKVEDKTKNIQKDFSQVTSDKLLHVVCITEKNKKEPDCIKRTKMGSYKQNNNDKKETRFKSQIEQLNDFANRNDDNIVPTKRLRRFIQLLKENQKYKCSNGDKIKNKYEWNAKDRKSKCNKDTLSSVFVKRVASADETNNFDEAEVINEQNEFDIKDDITHESENRIISSHHSEVTTENGSKIFNIFKLLNNEKNVSQQPGTYEKTNWKQNFASLIFKVKDPSLENLALNPIEMTELDSSNHQNCNKEDNFGTVNNKNNSLPQNYESRWERCLTEEESKKYNTINDLNEKTINGELKEIVLDIPDLTYSQNKELDMQMNVECQLYEPENKVSDLMDVINSNFDSIHNSSNLKNSNLESQQSIKLSAENDSEESSDSRTTYSVILNDYESKNVLRNKSESNTLMLALSNEYYKKKLQTKLKKKENME